MDTNKIPGTRLKKIQLLNNILKGKQSISEILPAKYNVWISDDETGNLTSWDGEVITNNEFERRSKGHKVLTVDIPD